MLWICTTCTTAYAVDAPACPHCGATGFIEQNSEEEAAMAKIRQGVTRGDATNTDTYPQGLHPSATGDLVDGTGVEPHGPYHDGVPLNDPAEPGRRVPTLTDDLAAAAETRAEQGSAEGVERRAAYDAARERDARGEATPEDGELLRSYEARGEQSDEHTVDGDGVQKDGDEHPADGTERGLVGEQGPESVNLSDGAEVLHHEKSADEPDYDSWTNDQLRAELGRRKLAKSGSKADQVMRLQANDKENPDRDTDGQF